MPSSRSMSSSRRTSSRRWYSTVPSGSPSCCWIPRKWTPGLSRTNSNTIWRVLRAGTRSRPLGGRTGGGLGGGGPGGCAGVGTPGGAGGGPSSCVVSFTSFSVCYASEFQAAFPPTATIVPPVLLTSSTRPSFHDQGKVEQQQDREIRKQERRVHGDDGHDGKQGERNQQA